MEKQPSFSYVKYLYCFHQIQTVCKKWLCHCVWYLLIWRKWFIIFDYDIEFLPLFSFNSFRHPILPNKYLYFIFVSYTTEYRKRDWNVQWWLMAVKFFSKTCVIFWALENFLSRNVKTTIKQTKLYFNTYLCYIQD